MTDRPDPLAGFVCQKCGACCRIEGIVRLREGDAARIAAHLGMDEADFIENETDLAPDRKGLVLKDRSDGACAMLDAENRCRIYPVRPEKCRTFPYEWTNANSCEYCPGLRGAIREKPLIRLSHLAELRARRGSMPSFSIDLDVTRGRS